MKELAKTVWHLLALLSVKLGTLSFFFLACLVVLFHIVHDVFQDGDTGFDNLLFGLADKIRSPEMTRFMKVVSFFGSGEYLMVALALVVLVFSFYDHMRWHSLRVLLITLTASVLHRLLKIYFGRPRPPFAIIDISSLSFPSGHAMAGGVFYGVLIYLTWISVRTRQWRWLLTVFLTLLILLIGFSRVYLKVHYATDVLAGYIMGLLWLLLSLNFLCRIERFYISRYKSRV